MSTVPAVASCIAPAETTGGVVSGVTETAATALVAVIGAKVAKTRYCVPSSDKARSEVVYELRVAPGILVQAVLPLEADCHCSSTVEPYAELPVAATEKVAVAPCTAVAFCGCWEKLILAPVGSK